MLGGAKEAMAERLAGQITPSETPIGQALANTIATIEANQAAALNRALDAADRDDVQVGQDPEDRRAQLLDLADAIADSRREEWWWENVAPELMAQPDQARQYVGMDADEYREQLDDWYQAYAEAGIVDEPLEEAPRARIGEIADRHVRDQFGIRLREFVATVVNWSPGKAYQRVLAGPIGQHTQAIHLLADEIERKNERIDELEARLEES